MVVSFYNIWSMFLPHKILGPGPSMRNRYNERIPKGHRVAV